MNREIKFRAWDGKKMLLNVGVHPHLCSDLSHDDEYYKDNQDGRWIIGLGFDSYKVMQYTGLKDKNGKEIYEGDIIREFGCKDCYSVIFAEMLLGKDDFNIGYTANCWGFEFNDKSGFRALVNCKETTSTYSAGVKSFEVIGNIYENPELLK